MPTIADIKLREAPERIQKQLYRAGFSPLIARLLAGRGILHERECTPLLKNLLSPELMKGMNEAVELCIDAIHNQKSVLVVGDYDCDGATATALLVSALRRWQVNTNYIVPNRKTMGYGLSVQLARLILANPPDLLITVDNGIASIEGVELLMSRGVQVLITDHHLPADSLPVANAIINPNQPNCPFPSKAIAGVGVAFYLVLAIRSKLRNIANDHKVAIQDVPLGEYLDLVALGTVADLVALDANNRILTHFGLKRIREGRGRAGINALILEAKRRIQTASTSDLGFYVGPRINAAGRMADMTLGIECLLVGKDVQRAEQLAANLSAINQKRRDTENVMKAKAIDILNKLTLPAKSTTITLHQENWHLGVIGIVASRVKDITGKPTFIFAKDEKGCWRGSGRSVIGLHLRDCLDLMAKNHPQLFSSFGGHAMAAGASINEVPSITFAEAFTDAAFILNPIIKSPVVHIDGIIDAVDMSVANVQTMEAMVWGQGFSPPLFLDDFTILRWQNIKDNHWKLWVKNERFSATALFFNVPETFNVNPNCTEAKFTFGLMVNHYRGNTEIVLRVENWL